MASRLPHLFGTKRTCQSCRSKSRFRRGLCCKTIFATKLSNIDSTNERRTRNIENFHGFLIRLQVARKGSSFQARRDGKGQSFLLEIRRWFSIHLVLDCPSATNRQLDRL